MSINNKRSYTEYTVTQPTTDFAIGFDDFDEGDKDNILVTLNGILVESLGYAAIRKNESTVSITPAITEGTVRLTRETDIDEPFHKFTAGALFSAKSMDENFQQVRHSQQEVRDGFEYLEYNTNGIIQEAKAATDRANEAADAVDDLTIGIVSASMVLTSTGRTQAALNLDHVNFKYTGAVGNGIIDDTTAIDNTVALNKPIHSTSGTYVYTGDIDALYALEPTGAGFLRYSGYDYPVQQVTKDNLLWQGEFLSWQMGYASQVSTTQRKQLPAGVTHARVGFAAGTTVQSSTGTHSPHALRVQRNAGNTSTATHSVVMNLTQLETAPLLGKRCTLVYQCASGSDYSGTSITARVQCSEELSQPILNANGTYTSGHSVLGSKVHTPTVRPESTPYYVTVDIPEDATQVAVCFDVPFTGTALAEDWVELERVALAVSSVPYVVTPPHIDKIKQVGLTRYQSSYQYGVPRGASNEQGALTAVSCVQSAYWAFQMDVRFNPPMAGVPWFTFQSPTSGVEFRFRRRLAADDHVTPPTGTNIGGMAFNLSDAGCTITNYNATVAVGDKLSCHWTAEYLY